MKVYNYHPDTKEYIGESAAQSSPLEPGVFLIPAYATTDCPPEVKEKEVAVWDGENWNVEADYRGDTFYHKETGQAVIITAIGEISGGLIIDKPVPPVISEQDAQKAAVLKLIPGLKNKILLSVVQFVVGEIDIREITAAWQELKDKMIEAEI